MAMLAFDVGLPAQVQALLLSMISIFDLDTPPVGDQLDIIGLWVGVSRKIEVPIDGVFFTWDANNLSLGWDAGTWQPTGETQIVLLPDDAYLTLIKGKIGANHWDGTTTKAYEILDSVFTGFTVLIQDNCDMSYAVGLIGGVIPALTVALLEGGYIPLKPEGIRISEYFISVDTNPAFCWDLNTANLAGWDAGSWLEELTPP